jgi:hypothetical protein
MLENLNRISVPKSCSPQTAVPPDLRMSLRIEARKRMKSCRLGFAVAAILIAAAFLSYELRAFLPYPNNYVTRLRYLDGWISRGYYGFNCAALLSNAHGERYLTEREMWAGARGKLALVAEYVDRHHVAESEIEPGDIAVFQGPTTRPYIGRGLHVAAYLGNGVWIDADARRGFVSKFRLADRPQSDPWFLGKVRIVRWNQEASGSWHLTAVADTFFTSNYVNDYRLTDDFANRRMLIAQNVATTLP